MTTSSIILQSYLNTSNVEMTDTLRVNVEKLLEYNNRVKGDGFLTPLQYYLDDLETKDKCLIDLLDSAEREKTLRHLQVTLLLLLSQQQYELEHQQYENKNKYDEKIDKCNHLIDYINGELNSDTPVSPAQGEGLDGNPVKYLFMYFAQYFATTLVNIADRKSKTIREAMTWFNDKRLYWVWGSSLLKMTLDMIPPDFFNASQAVDAVKAPDPYTGTISWALYYFRFSLNLFLLLKHTIRGPWMSEVEQQIPWTERFKTQWDQRKFTLLNDSIWATANLVCFFWLNGKYGLGPWGDLLTLSLLLFDVSMAIWDFAEQSTKYNEEKEGYEKDIKALKDIITEQQKSVAKEQNELTKQALLQSIKENELKCSGLVRALEKCNREWGYTQISLATGITYALGLMLAFALLTMPFLPVSGPAIMAITITGAVLCFAFTVINNAIKSGLEVYKAYASKQDAHDDYLLKLKLFKENPPIEENEKKLLFLQIKRSKAEMEFQKEMILFQTMHFLRSVFIEACTPALVFASFVFFPLGVGIGVLGAALGVAISSNILIELSKPEKQKVMELDQNENEYELFKKIHTNIKPITHRLTLFNAPNNEETYSEELDRGNTRLLECK